MATQGRVGTMSSRQITESHLISEIHRVSDVVDDVPTSMDMREVGKYSIKTYQKYFDSWNESLIQSGFEPSRHTNISDEDLINEILRLNEKFGSPPTSADMQNHGIYGKNVYNKRFGSWSSSLKEAGLSPNREVNISTNNLINNLHNVAEELGRTPQYRDLSEYGKYSERPYKDNFGSWNNALQAAGFEPYEYPTGEEHWGWEGGHNPEYGSNWKRQRNKCRERDDYECQECGLSREEHMEKYNRKLEAHHIVPKRKFASVEESNKLENLLLLCIPCHRNIEMENISLSNNE